MTDMHTCQIPIARLAYCQDCEAAFDIAHRCCPGCAGEAGWIVMPWGNKKERNETAEPVATGPGQTKREVYATK